MLYKFQFFKILFTIIYQNVKSFSIMILGVYLPLIFLFSFQLVLFMYKFFNFKV